VQHKKPVLLVLTELVHKRTFAQHADRALILAKRALSGNLCYDPYVMAIHSLFIRVVVTFERTEYPRQL